MKLIKIKNGYVNADKLESFVVIEHEGHYDIMAYNPPYGGVCEFHDLGECAEKWEAYQRLNALAEWLANGEDGIFDVLHIWESDNE